MLNNDNTPAQPSLLICEFLVKYEMTVITQQPYSQDLAPADFVFFPEVDIHSKRSPISDDRRDRRKFFMGPMHYLAKRVSKLEKTMEAVYRQCRGVLWRRKVLISCKLLNKCFKKKVWLLFGQTIYLSLSPYT
jgi:hypothetical protein